MSVADDEWAGVARIKVHGQVRQSCQQVRGQQRSNVSCPFQLATIMRGSLMLWSK
jgi:hypothetical protein